MRKRITTPPWWRRPRQHVLDELASRRAWITLCVAQEAELAAETRYLPLSVWHPCSVRTREARDTWDKTAAREQEAYRLFHEAYRKCAANLMHRDRPRPSYLVKYWRTT